MSRWVQDQSSLNIKIHVLGFDLEQIRDCVPVIRSLLLLLSYYFMAFLDWLLVSTAPDGAGVHQWSTSGGGDGADPDPHGPTPVELQRDSRQRRNCESSEIISLADLYID